MAKLTEDKLFQTNHPEIKKQFINLLKEHKEFEDFYGNQLETDHATSEITPNVKDKYTSQIRIGEKVLIVPNMVFVEECRKAISVLTGKLSKQEKLIEHQRNEISKLRAENGKILNNHNNSINHLSHNVDAALRLAEQVQKDFNALDKNEK